MRILFDTDVILDVILDRDPFVEIAAELWELHRQGKIDGLVASVTLVNVFYIARKFIGAQKARKAVEMVISTFEVCPIDESILRGALSSPITDYEDAVQHECALAAGAEGIVTRNIADFQNASLPIFSPGEIEGQVRNIAN